MALRIEDYALIGDCHTAALVGRDGSIDWLCLPRFDSGACFSALLGTPEHGRWLLAPAVEVRAVRRRYRPETLVLETEFETADGVVTVVDCMTQRDRHPNLVRVVEGKRGSVPMRLELVLRFDYGSIVPWVQHVDDGISAIAGPDRVLVRSVVPLRGENFTTVADFVLGAGQQATFSLTWHASHEEPPPLLDPRAALRDTEKWWRQWAAQCTYQEEWRDAVLRSLITLKAMIYAPTGGMVAAPTMGLPERVGGVRNWDYRYCWLRDATLTLLTFIHAGYIDEAHAWRDWLLRAVAGRPAEAQILYGLHGERRLTEVELPWLPGYENSRPVRLGNAASTQFQLDIYGEVIDALYQGRLQGLAPSPDGWSMGSVLVNFLKSAWTRPDEGLWEVRGPRRHFTHSKVMAWVAVDRMIKAGEKFGHSGPLAEWAHLRDTIHDQVCLEAFDPDLGAFVQSYGSKNLDASLLMMPLVGFLPATDPRVVGTVAAIEQRLLRDGFVQRYANDPCVDGLPGGEGAFLPCTFWLADNYYLQGRTADARRVFEHLLSLRNDVGLLSEEYEPKGRRLVGNFPQAFSHVGLVNTALNLSSRPGPADNRPKT